MKHITSTLLGLFVAGTVFAQSAPKPNVVLILADDLGWQDVGCYDIDEPSPMETPNIDRLAKKGVLFRQGYSPAPTCAPTRCAIMSGRHPAALQKTHVVGGNPPTPYSRLQHPIMDPWYSGRMELEEVTIPEALKENGYVSGHVGKWHMAIDHNAFPQPEDQGFDFTRHHLGESAGMRPHRLTGFATTDKNDPYQLDKDGFPKDQTTLDAIEFMQDSKDKPFFLYYAAWLVHTPIHSRSRELLEKYCRKLGVDFPTDPEGWALEGQKNPYYCAMVEMFDHYVGQIVGYLEQTDDPRNPGYKLIDNTYIILTSDNGGMESHPGEVITDNYPLDKGKINAKEGGVRVPFLISGPGIPAGKESDVIVSGLDFYPTILSWTGTAQPKEQNLDGCDLSDLLAKAPDDASLVKEKDGSRRDTMVWHFPHGVAQQSTIRKDGWKLIVNHFPGRPLELYQLNEDGPANPKRVDIEEAKNLAQKMPAKAEELKTELYSRLNAMNASFPYLNPSYKGKLPHKESVCTPVDHGRDGATVWASFKENGAKVVKAQLAYTLNGGTPVEEWYVAPARIEGDRVSAELPEGTTHYVFNFIDEHNFLVSYPEVADMLSAGKRKRTGTYSPDALAAEAPTDTIQLWPAGTPGTDPSIPEKTVRDTIINNIHNPTLSVHRPSTPNGCAVVICPGGAYSVLSIVNEGTKVAEFLNSQGITAFVLKYRLPNTPGAAFKDPVPLSDALRAVQWVRHHAADFGVDPARIGIMGFSAGGHLAASAGTRYSLGSKFGNDAIAHTPARPDFMALVYPVISTDQTIAHNCPKHLLPADASPEALATQSLETLVTSETPPAFLAHAKNDSGVVAQNSEVMHRALEKVGVPSSLNLYKQGGHGFGLGNPGDDSSQWPAAFVEWLKSRDFI